MTRIQALKREEMDLEQGRVYDETLATTKRVGGPAIGYAYSPGLWGASTVLAAHVEHCTLTPRQLRICGMATTRHFNASFPWSAQARMGMEAGLDRSIVDAINSRQKPMLVDQGEMVVFEATQELLETGTLSDLTFSAATVQLGTRCIVDMVGAVAYFTMTAMTANLTGVVAAADAQSKLIE